MKRKNMTRGGTKSKKKVREQQSLERIVDTIHAPTDDILDWPKRKSFSAR